MNIVLLSCVKSKLPHKAKAVDLYSPSALFRGSLEYARSLSPDSIYILSAKYGLLELDDIVEPYEETLKGKPVAHVRRWSDDVLHELEQRHNLREDHFVILAGQAYRRFLTPAISHYDVPLEGLSFGKQLSFYGRSAA